MVAHGCTGKGNDQVRFEVGLAALRPGLTVHRAGPGLRHDQGQGHRLRGREGPADRRDRRARPTPSTRTSGAARSRPGTWRTSGTPRSEDVYDYTSDPAEPREPDELVLSASPPACRSRSTARPLSPLEIITELNASAGAQGIGRIDMVEDRLVGIKSREIYEAPGAIALIAAHSGAGERLRRARPGPVQAAGRAALDRAGLRRPVVLAAQAAPRRLHRPRPRCTVTGDVRMTLHGGRAVVTGRRSEPRCTTTTLATYDTGDIFDQSAGQGLRRAVGTAEQDCGHP